MVQNSFYTVSADNRKPVIKNGKKLSENDQRVKEAVKSALHVFSAYNKVCKMSR